MVKYKPTNSCHPLRNQLADPQSTCTLWSPNVSILEMILILPQMASLQFTTTLHYMNSRNGENHSDYPLLFTENWMFSQSDRLSLLPNCVWLHLPGVNLSKYHFNVFHCSVLSKHCDQSPVDAKVTGWLTEGVNNGPDLQSDISLISAHILRRQRNRNLSCGGDSILRFSSWSNSTLRWANGVTQLPYHHGTAS